MSTLYFTLLGPPQVRHADQVLLFSTRKELALLLYLAVEGRPHLRKHLSELFWPEGDALHGRAALRITLFHLRNMLDVGAGADAVPHLLIKRDTLALDLTSDVTLDLHTLHEAWTLARASTHTTLTMPEDAHRSLLVQLQRATSLARGEFLEGFSLRDAPAFDDWARFQREYWYLHLNDVFDRLSYLQFAAGELAPAIETVSRWLVLAPRHEDAYRRLMRLHFAAGDRAAALHAYDVCRALLATEMQTEPTAETVALASHLRAVAPPRRKEARTPPGAFPPAALLNGPLLGRTTELSTLTRVYHTMQRGQTQVVLLEGEVGMGKTRLATEFLAWAQMEGADVLKGQAFEAGGHLPYQPVIEALRRRIERENAPDDLLSDTWLAELSRLLPELCERYPDLPAPIGDKSVARNRLFEAVARLLQALAARTPLVLFIDDVQWADASSFDVLHYLARSFAESATPVLLLFTLRRGAVGLLPGLAEWRAGMERVVPLTRLQLGPLTTEDILHLLHTLGGKDGRRAANLDRFGQWLFAETEGQPLYLMETLKVLLERDVLTSQLNEEGRWTIDCTAAMDHETVVRGFFPPSVREVICARLDRLTPNAFALLVAGAVLGQGITFEQLCQVAEIEEHEGLPALDEVLRSGLLQESEHAGGRMTAGGYVFAHEKIRAVVHAEAGEARRRIFHRRALEALQAAAAPAAILAYHALAAGLAEPAFRWSLAAGDEAMRMVAVRDALTFYEQARLLLAERWHGLGLLTMLPAPAIEHLYIHLGRAYELNAEWEKARTAYRAMLAYAQDAGERVMESTILNRLAILAAQQSFDLATAQTLLEEARRVAEASGDRVTLAETEWNLAQMAIHAWNSKRALLHAERALELARITGRKELTARSLYTLGLSYAFGGRWQEVVAYGEEARMLYAEIEDSAGDGTGLPAQVIYAGSPPSGLLTNQAMEVLCLCLLALGHVNRGEPQAGVNAGRVALDISLRINNVWTQVYSVLNLNHALLEVGEYEEALRVTRKGVELARMLPNPTLLFFMLTVLGAVQQAMLRMEEARAALIESLALTETIAVRSYHVLATSRLCANRVLAGDWKSAYAYALETIAVRNDVETSLLFIDFLRYYETEALLQGGDEERAREDVQRLGESSRTNRRQRIPYLRARATLAQWDGETREAIAYLQEAATLAKEIGLPGELWQIQVALGEVYTACGQREQASQMFAQAGAIVRELAEKMGDGVLRTNFLTEPAVRHVLERGRV
ncbi:MAG TPA: AAA family ATPase [Ktedonobacteraceae bacterium]|nr:AAA family ATPase [Ktedonobacteraceae bacterium]